MQPYIKNWYDYLKEGKIMGLKCNSCGSYQFPPVPVCNEPGCTSTDLEWVEMSGDATLTSFSMLGMGKPLVSSAPLLCGFVTLAEGPRFMSWITDYGPADQMELFARMPFPVRLETKELFEGICFPVIRNV
jgi:uncharacterized OB-fold protein